MIMELAYIAGILIGLFNLALLIWVKIYIKNTLYEYHTSMKQDIRKIKRKLE
jgi:hypothetical protein